jgi:hypothetical protein
VSAGYTYTTIQAGPDEPVRIGVLCYLDDAASIRVCGQDNDRPQLWIAHGDVSVTILPTLGQVTAADARIARDLADKAAAYAAEVERLRAEHDAKAAADSAA